MKLPKTFLPLITGVSLVVPAWAEPAEQLVQNPSGEAAASDELSAKLGFAAHVPKNTEGYFSLIGAADLYDRLAQTALGKTVKELMAEQGADLDDLEGSEEFSIFKAVVGEELFIAFGDSAGEQGVYLNAVNRSYNYHSMKMMVKMLELNFSADPDLEKMSGLMSTMMKEILTDPDAGIGVFEKAVMPPVTLGFKVSDAEMRSQIFDTMKSGVLMATADGDFPGEEIEMKKDGLDITGVTLLGKKIAEMGRAEGMDDPDTLEIFGSAEKFESFLKKLETKNLNLALTQKGDYIVAYLGGSLDGLSFPAKVEDSLVANEGMDFMDNYASKDIRMLLFGEEEALDTLASNSDVIASLAKGLKAALAESDLFGDTRDVQALLGYVAKLEKSLLDMVDYSRTGMVGFLEDGFKIEGHGGTNLPSLDTETPHRYAGLGDLEDVVFFSNSRSNPEFTSKLYELLSSLGEASYLMAQRAAGLENDDYDFEQFKEGFSLIDQMFVKDLKEIWMAMTVDWAAGTGNEGALVIDTKGTLPKVPGVPGVILEEGLIPRIAYVTPVTDREKVSKAWKRIESSVAGILKSIGEMDGPEIPMQEINENMKDGVTFYSTAIQFSTRDARPVVGLSEEDFFFSTSQNFIGDLNASLKEGNAPKRTGSYTHIDFSAAGDFAKYWVTLMKENADAVFENEFQRDDFKANLPMFEKFLKAFGELDHFTSHVRMEDGEARSSVHLKFK